MFRQRRGSGGGIWLQSIWSIVQVSRSENHARPPDATVHQVRRRIRTQPVKIERSVLQGASHHSVPLRPFLCDATEGNQL